MQDTLLLDTDVVLVIVGDADARIRDDLVEQRDTLAAVRHRNGLSPLEQHRTGHLGGDWWSHTFLVGALTLTSTYARYRFS